jgi:hypothetical protein
MCSWCEAMTLAFIGAFPSNGKKRSSKELLNHYYFIGLVLGSNFPCGKKRNNMVKKKPRSTYKYYCLEVHARLCGIGGVNFLCNVNLLGRGRTRNSSSSCLKLT